MGTLALASPFVLATHAVLLWTDPPLSTLAFIPLVDVCSRDRGLVDRGNLPRMHQGKDGSAKGLLLGRRMHRARREPSERGRKPARRAQAMVSYRFDLSMAV